MKPENGRRERQPNGEPWLQSARRKATFEARRILAQARKVILQARIGQRWQPSDESFARRVYPDYESYLEHQRTKLDAYREKSIASHDKRFFTALSERLVELPVSLKRTSVLCLAARQGTEVRAFIEQGAFAIGIDLNPGRENRYVVVGDFHDLQFADRSIDLVFTNSLDHAFALDRILREVHRVLVDGGHLIVEAGVEPHGQGFYESFSWSSLDDLLGEIEAGGFALRSRTPFDMPWKGEQLLMQKVTEAAGF